MSIFPIISSPASFVIAILHGIFKEISNFLIFTPKKLQIFTISIFINHFS